MISCREAEFMISQLVDLELGSRQERKLKLHVENCSRCPAHMKDDEDAASAIRAPPPLTSPSLSNQPFSAKATKFTSYAVSPGIDDY